MSLERKRWALFYLGAAMLAIALAWVTWVALEMESQGRRHRIENREQEDLHRALARMDAALTTFLARESSRPWFHYGPFHQPGPAFTPDLHPVSTEGFLVASPLLTERYEIFHIYFAIDAQGRLLSPSVPTGAFRDLAEQRGLLPEHIEVDSRRLRELEGMLDPDELLAVLERLRPAGPRALIEADEGDARPQPEPRPLAADPEARRQAALDEFRFRNRLMSYANLAGPTSDSFPRQSGFVPYLVPGPATPELLFLREVIFGESRWIQGIWTNWQRLEPFLLGQVRDRYPQGHLRPAGGRGDGGARLVTIPFVFEPGPPATYEPLGVTPTRVALLGLWTALSFAAVAMGLTLRKTLELSERRRRFVSAVTHELRTPLTTFCMYSEMLADGMVREEGTRSEYLQTLKSESTRLRHIVDNVLSYARLEGRRGGRDRQRTTVEALLERVLPALERRTEEAGMGLVVATHLPGTLELDVDVLAVEQILFNLVDNACKYAADATDRRIHLSAAVVDARLELAVADHGPGIPRRSRKEVFKPFWRAVADAAGTTAGIGLGLALARGMAREMDGEVVPLERETFGAVLALRLPLAPRSVPPKD